MRRILFFLTLCTLYFSKSFSLEQTPFQPISINLETAMDMGERYSFDVKNHQSNLSNSHRQEIFSITEMGPSLNSSMNKTWYDHSHLFSNVNNNGEGNSNTSLSVTATQPLSGLFSGSLKIAQENATKNANTSSLLDSKIKARLETAKFYINVQQSLRTLEAKKIASKFADENFKVTKTLFDTGSAEKNKIDVLQTKAEASAARLDVTLAEQSLQTALISLASNIGLKSPDQMRISLEKASAWEQFNPQIPDLNVALQTALQTHPSIIAAQQSYNAAKYQLSESYFNYLPQVNLFATYSKNSSNFTYPTQTTINEFTYGLQLNWTLWDSGLQAAAMSDIINEKEKALILEDANRQNTSQQVQDAMMTLKSAIESLSDAKDSAKSYEDSFNLALSQYKIGEYSAINLIETQNKMTDAEVRLANIRSNLDLSWMTLQASLGKIPKAIHQ